MTAPADPSNSGQHRAIAIVLSKVDVTSRAHRLQICSRLTGRDLASTKDLRLGEAASIIRHLQQLDRVGELRMLADQYAPDVKSGGGS
jgi:hypothetical protein